jgi:predicted TIM-barrel fold metal-dependent hydrolase
VSLRAGDYRRTVTTTQALLAGLAEHEQQAVLAMNARRLYRLGGASWS